MFRSLFGGNKTTLIRQMGSSDNKQVLKAITALKKNGWFRDGSLHEIPIIEREFARRGTGESRYAQGKFRRREPDESLFGRNAPQGGAFTASYPV